MKVLTAKHNDLGLGPYCGKRKSSLISPQTPLQGKQKILSLILCSISCVLPTWTTHLKSVVIKCRTTACRETQMQRVFSENLSTKIILWVYLLETCLDLKLNYMSKTELAYSLDRRKYQC